jgi:hypothetical protein
VARTSSLVAAGLDALEKAVRELEGRSAAE